MRFSQEIKESLSEIRQKPETDEAELYAFVLTCPVSLHGQGRISLTFESPQACVARRVFSLLSGVTGVKAELSASRSAGDRRRRYRARVLDTGRALDILAHYNLGVPAAAGVIEDCFTAAQDQERAFIRGMFLSCGYASSPSSGYLVEFSTPGREMASCWAGWLRERGVSARTREKNSIPVVYVKNSQDYFEILALAGADRQYLLAQSVQASKDMRNTMKRRINCETANLNKTVDASLRQITAIDTLTRQGRLARLAPQLVEAARLRCDWPEAPLSELVNNAGGTVSRSTLDKRLRRLVELAGEAGKTDYGTK